MKNLANCKPSEFLKQTLRIKRNLQSWISSEEIAEIKARVPKYIEILDTMSNAEKGEALIENRKMRNAQAMINLMDILDVLMDKHADETLELLGLCCFVEKDHIDDYPVDDYLGELADLMESENVIRFFSSLARLGQTSISIVSRT